MCLCRLSKPLLHWLLLFLAGGLLSATALRVHDKSLTHDLQLTPEVQSLDQKSALPPLLEELLAGGQLWTAYILCTLFSQKTGGGDMVAGQRAEVSSPYLGGVPENHPPAFFSWSLPEWSSKPILLRKFGRTHCVVHLWDGQGAGGDGAIYVSFSPADGKLGHLYHLSKIWRESAKTWSADDALNMSSYVKRKFDELWNEHLADSLKEYATSAAFRNRTFIFSGISHGAALAQIASYRFARNLKDWIPEGGGQFPQFAALAFNPYLWTDQHGVTLLRKTVGDRLLNVIASQRQSETGQRYWDIVPCYGFGQGYVSVPQSYLMEVGCNRQADKQFSGDEDLCGDWFALDETQSCRKDSEEASMFSTNFITRIRKVHNSPKVEIGFQRSAQKARKRLNAQT